MSNGLLRITVIASALLVLGFIGGLVASAAPRRSTELRAPATALGSYAPPQQGAQTAASGAGPTGGTGGTPLVPTQLTDLGPATAAAADDPVHMTLRVDRTAVLQGSDGEVYAELELAADAVPVSAARAATDFVVVIDRSGSMAGDKLAFAKAAAENLIERLSPEDRFALVSYDDRAQRVVALAHATPQERPRFVSAIRALGVGGSTNLSSGLDRALDELATSYAPERKRRVLLLSDGLANQGDTTPHGLARRAAQIVQRGAVLSTMGIGDDFDESVMTALSEAGSGNFYYLARLDALPEFFQSELKAAGSTVASNLTIEFAPGSGVQLLEASGYAIERSGGVARFSPGTLSSGQKRSLWLTLSVPALRPGSFALGAVQLRYQRDGKALMQAGTFASPVACVTDEAAYRASIVREVWERAVRSEEYGKYQRRLSDAVQNGNEADLQRMSSAYQSKNRALADALGSRVVLESLTAAERAADDAKRAQAQSAAQRAISVKRMKAGAGFQRKRDAYLSDPDRGLY